MTAHGGFAASAARLAGVAGVLLHWPPDAFWRATPAELEAVLAVLTEGAGEAPPPDAALIDTLKGRFPDG